MAQWVRKLRRALLNEDASFCDMHEDPKARGAAAEYLGHIQPALRVAFGDRTLSILDAGCQAGRLLIPLAEGGHRLIGLDTSGFALRRAAGHAKARRLSVLLHRGGIAALRRWVKPAGVDAVVCTEVLYLCRDHEALLHLLVESVKPGGLACVSHRPAAYYVAEALERGDAPMAASLLERSEGRSPEGDYHNWQTEDQLRAQYASLGCRVLGCHPVDFERHRVDRALPADAALRDALEPLHEADSTYRVPSYLLVIAQKVDAIR